MDWSMGGYGFYVWGAYLFAFAAIGLEVFSLNRRKRSYAQLEKSKTKHDKRDDSRMIVETR